MKYLSSFLILAILSSCKNDVHDLEFGFTVNHTNDWKQVGDKLITNFQNMYNLHINHEPDDSDYPYKGWFFGWVKDQCNEGYAGCDAIYAAKSKSLTGPWLIYSGNNSDGSQKWTNDDSIEEWVPVIAGGINNYDNWHNGDPSVVKYKDTYYMAYSATGFNKDGIPFGHLDDTDSDISVIMGAISKDGLEWIKSKKPILIYEPQWGQSPINNGDYMHELGSYHRPSLMVEDDKFKIWFDGYVKNSFDMLYGENSSNFMDNNDWKIMRGMDNQALISFPNPDIVKIEDLYLGFGDPPHPEAPEEGWGKRKITIAVSLNGKDWKLIGYIEGDEGWQGNMVPEAMVEKDGDNYVIYLSYGTMINDHFHQDSIRMKSWEINRTKLENLIEYASL